jgi:hypothetical protein
MGRDTLSATAPEKTLVPYSAVSILTASAAGEGFAAGGPGSEREGTESRSFWMLTVLRAGERMRCD